MSSWKPTSYKIRNWREHSIALKQRGSLTIWSDPDLAWEANPIGKRGRQNTCSDVAVQTCLTMSEGRPGERSGGSFQP